MSRVAVGILIVSVVLGCAEDREVQSNIQITNEDAKGRLEERLAKTEQTRTRVRLFRDAVRPIEKVLSEIAKVADITINGNPGDRILTFVVLIREMLKTASEGLIEFRRDGSWYLERRLNNPEMIEKLGCESLRFVLSGERIGNSEELSFSISQCDSRQLQKAALLRVLSSGLVEASIYPSLIEELLPDRIEFGLAQVQCSATLSFLANHETVFSCDRAFFFRSNFFLAKLEVDRIAFKNGVASIDSKVRLTVESHTGPRSAFIELHGDVIRGEAAKPRIDICPNRFKYDCGFSLEQDSM